MPLKIRTSVWAVGATTATILDLDVNEHQDLINTLADPEVFMFEAAIENTIYAWPKHAIVRVETDQASRIAAVAERADQERADAAKKAANEAAHLAALTPGTLVKYCGTTWTVIGPSHSGLIHISDREDLKGGRNASPWQLSIVRN